MLAYFFLTPVFAENIDLPQASWVPDFDHATGLVYFFQVICLWESIPVAVIIDGTFLLMCGELEIQFALLKKTLEVVKIGKNATPKHENECLEKLKACAAYHNFLLLLEPNFFLKKYKIFF